MLFPFNLNNEEIMTFCAVLVRFSVLAAVLPFIGDRMVPGPVKVLLALAFSVVLYPSLVAGGFVRPGEAMAWSATGGGIARVIGLEALTAVILGYTAKLSFESISFGANLVGNYMGFSAASIYDPHQESNSQVVAEIQTAIAMLAFLALDGHHLMLQAALGSYQILGLGAIDLGPQFSARIIQLTGEVVKFGIQMSAPMAVAIFAVNVVFGVMAKAMPQMNVLVISFGVTALIGLVVLMVGMPEFQVMASDTLGQIGDRMLLILRAMNG